MSQSFRCGCMSTRSQQSCATVAERPAGHSSNISTEAAMENLMPFCICLTLSAWMQSTPHFAAGLMHTLLLSLLCMNLSGGKHAITATGPAGVNEARDYLSRGTMACLRAGSILRKSCMPRYLRSCEDDSNPVSTTVCQRASIWPAPFPASAVLPPLPLPEPYTSTSQTYQHICTQPIACSCKLTTHAQVAVNL